MSTTSGKRKRGAKKWITDIRAILKNVVSLVADDAINQTLWVVRRRSMVRQAMLLCLVASAAYTVLPQRLAFAARYTAVATGPTRLQACEAAMYRAKLKIFFEEIVTENCDCDELDNGTWECMAKVVTE